MKNINVPLALLAFFGLGFAIQAAAWAQKHDEHHHHGGHHATDAQARPHLGADLKTIMIELGRNMDSISRALWAEDFHAISESARAIANHPHVSGNELVRIKGTLGNDFSSFVAADKQVHDAAIKLSAAAKTHKVDTSVDALSELQSGCVSCHTSFRARLTQRRE